MLSVWEGIPSLDRVSQNVLDDHCFSEEDFVDRMGNSLILEKGLRGLLPEAYQLLPKPSSCVATQGEVCRTVGIEKDLVLSS